jgi:hypothetical protein
MSTRIRKSIFAAMLLAASCVTLAAEPERSHRGSCSTVVTPITEPGVFPQELQIDSDCRLTHLGHASGQTTQIVVPLDPPGAPGEPGATIPLLITNTTVYRAANGDELFMSFIGTGQLNLETGEVTFVGTETYQGGTGRFANATGSATAQGSASVFTNLGSFTIKGRIAY